MNRRVSIDWTACRGRGTCSELLPERIVLDEWGFPIIDPTPVEGDVARFAELAVSSCPVRALRFEEVSSVRRRKRPAPSVSTPTRRTDGTR